MRARAGLTLAVWGVMAAAAAAQTVSADRLSVGGSKLRPDSSTTVRLDGLATTGSGTTVLFGESDGDVFRRALVSGDLPTTITSAWTFSAGLTSNAATSVNSTLNVTGLGTFSGGLSTTTLTANTLAAGGNLSVATVGGTVAPSTNIGQTLGSPTAMWNAVYARELRALTLVAQDVVSTIGGWLYVGPTTKLLAAAASGAGRIVVEHNEAAVNDRLYLSARSQAEIMVVTAGPTACSGDPAACGGISTGYYYDVTRGDASTGADNWLAGDAVMNTGVIGDCFIEQYAFTSLGAGSAVGPTVVGNCRTANSGYSWGPRWAIGQLNGLYGIATSTFGAAFGDPSDVNTLITATYWKLRDGTTDKFSLDGATGNMSLTGNLTVSGSGAFVGSGITMDATGLSSAVSSTAIDGNSYRFAFNANGMTAGGLYAYTDATNNVLLNRMVGASASDNYRVEFVAQNTYPTGAGTVSSQLISGPTGLQWSVDVNDGNDVSNSLVLTKTDLQIDGATGETQTITVRNSLGTGTCTLVFTQGIKTGGPARNALHALPRDVPV